MTELEKLVKGRKNGNKTPSSLKRAAIEKNDGAQTLYADAVKTMQNGSASQTPYADAAAQSSDYSGYLDIGKAQNRADRVQAAWMKNDPELAQSVGYITGPGRGNQFSAGGGQTGTLNQTVYDSIDSGMTRNETWDVLADDYRQGLITKEEFADAIHYADYLEAMKLLGRKPSDAGYAEWRRSR